jgi:TPP-dependent pyruvate/acetoin dehydrogenase alpha subunit
MAMVRLFEDRLFELFAKGELFGTTHGYIGQEANAVGVLDHLADGDIVMSNHRCHGHYLVRTGDLQGLMAELMGREGGTCAGRGGSQHLCQDDLYTNGVLGSTVPIAAGMAFAERQKGNDAIAVLFMGDGACAQGTFYETMNMASLWNVPLLIVVENNRYAQTTPLSDNFAGSFTDRGKAFGIKSEEMETNDVEALHSRFGEIIQDVRTSSRPRLQVLHTYRLCGHSKGDDFRPRAELAEWWAKDPLALQRPRLNASRAAEIDAHWTVAVTTAVSKASAMPYPSL